MSRGGRRRKQQKREDEQTSSVKAAEMEVTTVWQCTGDGGHGVVVRRDGGEGR
jgi:hypothetical protein